MATDNSIPVQEIIDLIKAGKTCSGDFDTRPDKSDPPTVEGDLVLSDLVIMGSLEFLSSFTIEGNLVFKNVVIKGSLDLENLSVEGSVVFDGLTVGGYIACTAFWPRSMKIKKLEVAGGFEFGDLQELTDERE